MLPHLEYSTSTRQRICRLCGCPILPNTWALGLRGVHASPKVVDLYFHEGCFERSLTTAKETRNATIS